MTHAFFLVISSIRARWHLAALLSLSLCGAFDARSALAANALESTSGEHGPVRLLVLDLELVGDLSDPASNAQHEARIKRTSDQLRAELSRVPRYEVVDATPVRKTIEALSATTYLYKCNGCEIDIAEQVGAELVLVAWIHRVSQLILTLTYEIREVPSGEPIRRKAFDFRGDTDTSWSRAVTYMVKDLAAQ